MELNGKDIPDVLVLLVHLSSHALEKLALCQSLGLDALLLEEL